ncbi:hypothetical protein GCK72_008474 [Caenorhabditis remanei]|uniref:Uncharacterized protein n=1 Tax=Caenorhabditis remanei TaxID=31234 RepID=A0A6A5GXP6_CAERE|nr:hypothetical protein GCK72_008474 [Caenorhabditis remanei]KAF1760228.1 hypothetical protein GCK72_008474 [Caenorhabditis remanei]
MSIALFLCLLTASQLYADVVSISTYASPSLRLIDEELTNLSSACLSSRDDEEITGYVLKHGAARFLNTHLLEESVSVIGLIELRSVLGFAPYVPWTHRKNPTDDEIAASSTIEEFYELKEPLSVLHGPYNDFVLEKYLAPAIAFLDKRFPIIRDIYRMNFEKSVASLNGNVDREGVEYMIKEYINTFKRVEKATKGLREGTIECNKKRV